MKISKSISLSFALGSAGQTGSAGSLKVKAEAITAALYSPASLTMSVVQKTVEVIYDEDTGRIRQVTAPEALVDITALPSPQEGYAVAFYAADPGRLLVPDTRYYDVSGETPFRRFVVENPDAGTASNRLLVSEYEDGGATPVKEYLATHTTPSGSSTWSLAEGADADSPSRMEFMVKEQLSSTQRQDTYSVTEGDGQTARHVERRTFTQYTCGSETVERMTLLEVDPDGANLVTAWEHYTAQDGAGKCGQIKSVVNPDGSWVLYDHEASSPGRKLSEIQPWGDSLMANPGQGRSITYDYTPLTGDGDSPDHTNRPRTVTESVQGLVVSRTFYVYYTDIHNRRVEIVEQDADVLSGTGFGDAGNPATTTVYYSEGASGPEAGRVYTATYSDGRQDTYTYETGTYGANSEERGAYGWVGTGEDLRSVVTQGTVASPDGIAGKTTQSVTIVDAKGDQVFAETLVYTGSTYAQIQWTAFEHVYDTSGRVIGTNTYKSNNGQSTSLHECCNHLTQEVDEMGGITTYDDYDSLGRLLQMTRVGVAASGNYPAQADVVTTTTYDAMGRVLSETTTAGDPALSLTRSSTYDVAGRLLTSTDESGLITTYDYDVSGSGGRVVTVTRPSGAQDITEITEYFRDGRVKNVTGTGVVHQYYDYWVDSQTRYRWSASWRGTASKTATPFVTETATDALGRTVVTTEAFDTSGVTLDRYHVYDAAGRLAKVETRLSNSQDPFSADMLYVYDDLGNVVWSGLDIDEDGELTADSMDRISETDTSYVLFGTNWWLVHRTTAYTIDNDDTPMEVGIQRQQLTGLGSPMTERTISIDVHGNATTTTVEVDRENRLVMQLVEVPEVPGPYGTVTRNGLLQSSSDQAGLSTRYGYDALRRQNLVIDSRDNETKTTYYTSGTGAAGKVESVENGAEEVVTYGYSVDTGRPAWVANEGGKKQYSAYTLRGELWRTWGEVPYPVEYAYDAWGRKVSMTTFRSDGVWDGSTWPGSPPAGDTTLWRFGTNGTSKYLTAKEYADATQVTYTNLADGRLATRSWARTSGGNPLVTTYTYGALTGETTEVSYSDSTPTVSFTYDRLGRQETITDAVGTRTFGYNVKLQLRTEAIEAGQNGLYSKLITRKYETYAGQGGVIPGRNRGLMVGSDLDEDEDYEVSYSYNDDDGGRLARITGPGLPAWGVEYGRLADSHLVQSLAYKSNGNTTLATTERAYEEKLDSLDWVANTIVGLPDVLVSKYDYRTDERGRRTDVVQTGSAFATPRLFKWSYNERNELVSADRHEGDDPDDPGNAMTPGEYTYNYDPIGNRLMHRVDTDASRRWYCANNVNQYTAIDDEASTCPTPSTPVAEFAYDADGNLLSDGTRQYTWDAENRLIGAAPGSPGAGAKKVAFAYDYMGRRVRKAVYAWDTGGSQWESTPMLDELYVYDGWNVVLVLNRNASNAVTRQYTWGLDLSGLGGAGVAPGVSPVSGIHGAGGIGGLLAVVETQGTTTTADDDHYWYFYNGNGNVGQLLRYAAQANPPVTLAAHYEYDPYGQTLTVHDADSSGYAAANPLRFSTKWFDAETGLGYWGYRYYTPELGRWMNRDPINEPGAVLVRQTVRPATAFIPRNLVEGDADSNLYRYVDNSPTVLVDALALWKIDRDGGAYAYVTPEKGDTVERLAQLIGLEAADYRNWMTQLSNQAWAGPSLPASTSQAVDHCGIWKVPNTILAWWGGHFGGFGKFWVMWDMDVSTLHRRGFNVHETGPGTASILESLINSYQGDKQLHGWLSWSHGFIGGILTDADMNGKPGASAYWSYYSKWHPHYKMAVGILFACETASAQGDFSSNAIFWGKSGTLVPHGSHLYGPTVAELIPPGAQGTRQ